MKIVKEHIDEAIKHLAPKSEDEIKSSISNKFWDIYEDAQKSIEYPIMLFIEDDPFFKINGKHWYLKVALIDNDLLLTGHAFIRFNDRQFEISPNRIITNVEQINTLIDQIDKINNK